MSSEEHMRQARERLHDTPAKCGILTISDTRTEADDASGDRARSLLEASGHVVVVRSIVPDEPSEIGTHLDRMFSEEIELLITTGGTGIAPRDGTVEVVAQRIAHELPGFGELFRHLSYEEIGAAAMLSRALGGLVARDGASDLLLFALPGSTKAVELALKRLILPQLQHMRALAQGVV